MRRQHQKGFTLVELAIVLVIIGLIVGGVLVGQDLIKAATVRSTLSDIEKYNAAATTFRNKYAGLPGDLLANNATQFGLLTATGRDGTAGRGDGNGLVEGCAAAATTAGCETALFWVDLSTAALIPQNLSTYASATTVIPDITSIATMSGYFPTQKVRQGTFAYVYPVSGRNHFIISTITTGGGTGTVTAGPGITPGEARSMDEKLDDALPATGVVQAVSALATVDAGAAAATGVCVNSTPAPDTYNVGTAFVDEINCRVRLRASF
ncbi:MAG: type II secretion system protein [Rickettsiales bacterium]